MSAETRAVAIRTRDGWSLSRWIELFGEDEFQLDGWAEYETARCMEDSDSKDEE